jgi:hypothetical protein
MLNTALKFCAIASKKPNQYTHFRASYITIKGLDGALHLQATDGHRVHSIKCRIDHNLPTGTTVQVAAEDLDNAVKALGRNEVSRVALNETGAPDGAAAPLEVKDNGTLTLHLKHTTLIVKYYLNSFDPLQEYQVRRPKVAEPVWLIGFDTGLLADAHKAFKMLKPVHGAVRFEFYGDTSGAVLTPEFPSTVAALYDACIIIMPCRIG